MILDEIFFRRLCGLTCQYLLGLKKILLPTNLCSFYRSMKRSFIQGLELNTDSNTKLYLEEANLTGSVSITDIVVSFS